MWLHRRLFHELQGPKEMLWPVKLSPGKRHAPFWQEESDVGCKVSVRRRKNGHMNLLKAGEFNLGSQCHNYLQSFTPTSISSVLLAFINQYSLRQIPVAGVNGKE